MVPRISRFGGTRSLVRSEARSAALSVRRGWRPIAAIQAAAFGLVGLYALSPTFREAMTGVARAKAAGGVLFAALATIVASLVLPEIAARLTRHPPILTSARLIAFYAAFFGGVGTLVYAQYELWARVIGTDRAIGTVLTKVALDMGFFTPFLSIPLSTLAMAWRDAGFSWSRMPTGELAGRYVRTLLPSWAFWIPTVAAVYAMPTDLQFPLFLLAQAAWAILLVTLAPEARG